ncbi:enoyl-CoA hydratase/isomerase family protein [Nitriliruptor alkaliphilus]|uniref:enoyl-CoA hydratase/isomerase family protein n=1 Tax=Nitriliruptor alkaliphilus TaxID=427918 RepID=UPI0006961155|nr:enoyl-CoA hydratase/isomerase family protein [Nitriliruptor alkaliphilus]
MTVHLDRRGVVATLTIDRPDAGNRLDGATVDELSEHLRALQLGSDPADVVVLAGSGPDFSLGRQPANDGPPTPSGLAREFARIQGLNELVQRYPAVTVAKLQGKVRGAALSLAGRCDLVVADEDARLSFPEVRDGIPPTIVLSYYRYALPSKALLDLILTGREIDAQEGCRVNLVSRVAPAGQLDATVEALVDELTGHDPRTLRTIKRFLAASEGMDPRDAPAYGMSLYANEIVDRRLQASGGPL